MKSGDLVKLKSGGPLMTVDIASANTGGLKCIWFADNNLCEQWFNKDALRLAPEVVPAKTKTK